MFSKRFKKCRELYQLSQGEAAEKLGIHRTVVNYYEAGTRKPDIEMLARIAQLFHTSTDYLLGLSESMTTQPDIKAVSDYTGLSDTAVAKLHEAKGNFITGTTSIVNFIVERLNEDHDIVCLLSTYVNADFSNNDYLVLTANGNVKTDKELTEIWEKETDIDLREVLTVANIPAGKVLKQTIENEITAALSAFREEYLKRGADHGND